MVSIIGWGHSKFGKSDESLEQLIIQVGKEALDHAGLNASEVDNIYIGHFNSGMIADGFISSMAFGIDPALRFSPATRVENACASGSAAVYAARQSILSGEAKVSLVIGVEKMTHISTKMVTKGLSGASYQAEEAGVSFPELFARFAQSYENKYGNQNETLAKIAVKNHDNALKNPLAHLQKSLDLDFCMQVSDRNPMIAAPLKVTDCSLISDGAAAVVLASSDVAKSMQRSVNFAAAVQVNDFLPMSKRDLTGLDGVQYAVKKALAQSKMALNDINLAEVHDCFTIAELLIYEAMGLTAKGRGADAINDGIVLPSGSLPINLSGGLKAKGHPVGATGVSMHVMIARQLMNDAGQMQCQNAEQGMVINMGGSGVANYVSILSAGHRA